MMNENKPAAAVPNTDEMVVDDDLIKSLDIEISSGLLENLCLQEYENVEETISLYIQMSFEVGLERVRNCKFIPLNIRNKYIQSQKNKKQHKLLLNIVSDCNDYYLYFLIIHYVMEFFLKKMTENKSNNKLQCNLLNKISEWIVKYPYSLNFYNYVLHNAFKGVRKELHFDKPLILYVGTDFVKNFISNIIECLAIESDKLSKYQREVDDATTMTTSNDDVIIEDDPNVIFKDDLCKLVNYVKSKQMNNISINEIEMVNLNKIDFQKDDVASEKSTTMEHKIENIVQKNDVVDDVESMALLNINSEVLVEDADDDDVVDVVASEKSTTMEHKIDHVVESMALLNINSEALVEDADDDDDVDDDDDDSTSINELNRNDENMEYDDDE
uniref:Uncharacterized protein n=1 Tax=Drosophila-associated filamentous virus TaxID=2743186 RepID=A0A6M9TZZ1_9VIRU|nr:putative protein 45 [Drosophila-associated filamentous virus]